MPKTMKMWTVEGEMTGADTGEGEQEACVCLQGMGGLWNER